MDKHVESQADRRTERRSAGALLLLSRRAEKDAKAAVGRSVDEAVAEARRQTTAGRVRKAALLGALLLLSHGMAGSLREALSSARSRARRGAAVRAGAELAALGVASAGALGELSRPEDEVRAQAGADAVAASWRTLAIVAVSRATRKDEDPAAAIEATRRKVLGRAELTSRTEVAQAYNEEHVLAVAEKAGREPTFAKALKEARVYRVWSSVLEERTCPACASHHGEVSDLDGGFEGGDEPGDMHPRCLCTSYLTTEG